jgi:hypothetical protein
MKIYTQKHFTEYLVQPFSEANSANNSTTVDLSIDILRIKNMRATKAKVDSNKSAMFGQKQEMPTVKVLRSILTSYGHKLKTREFRPSLLKRVIALESIVGHLDKEVISELLARKVEVTRAAIKAG